MSWEHYNGSGVWGTTFFVVGRSCRVRLVVFAIWLPFPAF